MSDAMMRRTEVKVGVLLQLVIGDYIEHEQKSLATLIVNIKHLKPLADRSAERVKSHDIEQYKTERRKEGASLQTINLELAALSRAYSLGMRQGLIRSRPQVVKYSVGKKNRRKGFFERSDYAALLPRLLPYQRQCFRFSYICGWREGELFKLTGAENYLADPPTIQIFDSKNGDGRVLPLFGELGEIIEEQRQAQQGPFIFHYEGKPLNRTTFNKHWRRACNEANVRRYFHDTRRTASRNFRNAGVDQAERMLIIGHKTPDMDLRYGIVNQEDIRQSLMKLQRSSRVSPTASQTIENVGNGGEGGIRTPGSSQEEHTISSLAYTSKFFLFLQKFGRALRNSCTLRFTIVCIFIERMK